MPHRKRQGKQDTIMIYLHNLCNGTYNLSTINRLGLAGNGYGMCTNVQTPGVVEGGTLTPTPTSSSNTPHTSLAPKKETTATL